MRHLILVSFVLTGTLFFCAHVAAADTAFNGTLAALTASDPTLVPVRTTGNRWFVGRDGEYRSITPTKMGSAVMQATVTGPATLAFDGTVVDGDAGCAFTAKVGKNPAQSAVGTAITLNIPAGTHTITWSFSRGKTAGANAHATVDKMVWKPTWEFEMTGTYTGWARGFGDQEGLATMTVSAKGHVAGKLKFSDGTYPFSGTCLPSPVATLGNVTMLVGSSKRPFYLSMKEAGYVQIYVYGEDGFGSLEAFAGLVRNGWKDKPLSAERAKVLASCVGYYTMTTENLWDDIALDSCLEGGNGYLTMTVAKNGSVKAAGKLADGTPVSMSATLQLDVVWPYVFLYAAPSKYKKGYFYLPVDFALSDSGMAHETVLTTYWYGRWQNLNPRATGVLGEGFDRMMGVEGGYYNKAVNLADYYKDRALTALVDANLQERERAAFPPSREALAMATLDWPVTLEPNVQGTGFVVDEAGRDGAARFTMSVNRVTGLFNGHLRAVYPNGSRTFTKSFRYYGALTPVRMYKYGPVEGRGYFMMPEKSPAPNSYSFKRSYGVTIREKE